MLYLITPPPVLLGLFVSFPIGVGTKEHGIKMLFASRRPPKLPIHCISVMESESRLVPAPKVPIAGKATSDLRSDIPISSGPSNIEDIRQPRSDEIEIWRILHIASNCDTVYSGRKGVVETLMRRGL